MPLSNPKHRRVTLIAVAASLIAIAGGTFAYAHSNGGHGHMMRHGSGDHLEHMQEMLTRIGASDAQKAQIKDILTPAFEDMTAAHKAHDAAFRQFHEEITAPSIDRARLESQRAELLKTLDETSKRLVTAISDAAEVLSPEQRAAFAKQVHKHHGG